MRSPLISLTLMLMLATSPYTMAQRSINLPDIGDFSQQYLSRSAETRLGAAVLRRIRDQGLLTEDVQLTEYLASVGSRIAVYANQTGHNFTFFPVDDPRINAFAAPGGFIGVNTGLLLATKAEEELAGVLAHEIAHVSQRHIARMYTDAQRMSIPMAAAMLASALVTAANPQIGQAAMASAMAANAQRQINFTRANEQEADRIGTRLMAQAGFDPNGMAVFFGRLMRLSGGSAGQVPEFLLTHPLPRNRIADTLNRVTPTTQPAAGDRLAYYLAKTRARVLTNRNTFELIREFKTTLAKGGYVNEAAERYGYVLALKQAGRYEEAERQITQLLKNHPDRLPFRLEAADLALAKGDSARAWRLFENAKKLYPDDYTLAMHYGQALAAQGDPRKAMQILQPYLRRRPNDVPLYALYAQASQRAGDIATTHATLAEYYYLNGDLKLAIEQAELGLSKPGTTPYQQAQLQARLRQLKEELAANER